MHTHKSITKIVMSKFVIFQKIKVCAGNRIVSTSVRTYILHPALIFASKARSLPLFKGLSLARKCKTRVERLAATNNLAYDEAIFFTAVKGFIVDGPD